MSAHAPTLRAFAEYVRIIGLQAGDRYLVVNPSSTASATRPAGSPA